MSSHETYMQRCFQLALNGAGNVAPNPMVGAVLVHNGSIIGEGYHREYGGAHAEVNCINSVPAVNQPFITQSTLYVSLEPCAHYGKTPPCADLIIRMKIPVVVIGCRDSYEEVNGKGISKLEAAGITVITGVLEKEAIDLNRRFFTYHQKARPYIILKWAQSSDHKIARADRSRVLISNEMSNRLVHKWRSEEAGIMVGSNTGMYDNPELTIRFWKGNNPVRILIDKELRIPLSYNIFNDAAETIIFNYHKNGSAGNMYYKKINAADTVIEQVLEQLFQDKVQSVLVEGGTHLLQSFIDEKLWDEARVITNGQLIMGEGINAPLLKQYHFSGASQYGTDKINYYKPFSTIQSI